MLGELDEAQRSVEENQMTLDMLQSETTLERIQSLRSEIESRLAGRPRVFRSPLFSSFVQSRHESSIEEEAMISEPGPWDEFQAVEEDTNRGLDRLAADLSRFEGRGRSPDLDELEERQIDMEQARSSFLTEEKLQGVPLAEALVAQFAEAAGKVDGEAGEEARSRVKEAQKRSECCDL